MDKTNEIVGKKIKALRKLKQLTQEELGEKADLSYKYLGEVERGTVNPSLDSLQKISNGLGINVGDLFPGEKDSISLFSPQDIKEIKKAVELLNNIFSKI